MCKTQIAYTVDRALYCMFVIEKQNFYDVLFLCSKYNIKIYYYKLTRKIIQCKNAVQIGFNLNYLK